MKIIIHKVLAYYNPITNMTVSINPTIMFIIHCIMMIVRMAILIKKNMMAMMMMITMKMIMMSKTIMRMKFIMKKRIIFRDVMNIH